MAAYAPLALRWASPPDTRA